MFQTARLNSRARFTYFISRPDEPQVLLCVYASIAIIRYSNNIEIVGEKMLLLLFCFFISTHQHFFASIIFPGQTEYGRLFGICHTRILYRILLFFFSQNFFYLFFSFDIHIFFNTPKLIGKINIYDSTQYCKISSPLLTTTCGVFVHNHQTMTL